MSYVAQLLPDQQQARLLRDSLSVTLGMADPRPLTEDEKDALWAMLTKLVTDMRKAERR